MKIAFVLARGSFFSFYDRVVRHLTRQGHQVKLVYQPSKGTDNHTDRSLLACQAELPGCALAELLVRRRWARKMVDLRVLIDYAHWYTPPHAIPRVADIWGKKRLSPRLWRALQHPWFKRLIRSRAVQAGLRRLERSIPPDQAILDWLKLERPDVVAASPFVYLNSPDIEYVKAAEALGIPTVVPILSWDNLVTKGAFHHLPSLVLVWNELLRDEAVQIHGLPPERLFPTGAPVYDPWFELRPSLDRAAFCDRLGLDPGRPYLVYLASAVSMAEAEMGYVSQLAGALAAAPRTRGIGLVVRPHPYQAGFWREYAAPNVVVFPQGGDRPDMDEARRDYHHTLHHSLGVAALVTTGFLDAAVTDRPCLTVMIEPFRVEQTKRRHFHYLTKFDFISVADDLAGFVGQVADLAAGVDPKAAQRRKFVQDFLRPWGLDRPAAEIMARAIEAAARREPVTPQALGLI